MPRTKAPPKALAPVPPTPPPPIARSTRRAVPPEERQIDADRTRAALLAAALEEFSRRGFAGATVREIAARAGVSKDLIAYHFGSKQGLLAAVEEASATAAASPALDETALSLADSVLEALSDALIDPRALRLRAWRGLHGANQVALDGFSEGAKTARGESGSQASLAARQRSGELDPNLDPATLELVLLGAIAAPVVFPDVAHQLFGVEPGRREFEVRYREGLLALIEQLRPRASTSGVT
ncbi:MAG TPA: TetR family transcriptional regulator [Acidimicrobiales bacterium]|jgi:AcrR family transcriptional regulator